MATKEELDGYKILVDKNRVDMKVCYDDKVYNSSNWTPNPLVSTVPMLYIQISIHLFLSGLVFLFLKPFNQSPLVAEIIAGILMGPGFLGKSYVYLNSILPFISDSVLEHTMSIGTVYYMFQLGLDMNLTPMSNISRRITATAIAGMIIPLAMGIWSYFLLISPLEEESVVSKLKSAFVWATVLTSTNLPDLTRVLANLKLMRTEIGRTAITSSFVNDIATWFFIVIFISISRTEEMASMCISILALILFCTFLGRPALSWLVTGPTLMSHDDDDYNGVVDDDGCNTYKEIHVQFVLFGVIVSAFVTDAMGLGSFIGALMFGFIFPSGQLATVVLERLEKVTSWIFVPLYCLVNGIKSKVTEMVPTGRTIKHVILFMALSWAAKILSTFVVAVLTTGGAVAPVRMNRREIFTLGVLMNSKGLLALITINIGREFYLLDKDTSSVMVVTILLMMMSIPPVVKYVYNPKNNRMPSSHGLRRTIQSATATESTFPIVVCVHALTGDIVQGMTSLLRMSNPTVRSKIFAVGICLVELTEHTAAAMLIVHDAAFHPRVGDSKLNSGQTIHAMEELERDSDELIKVECLTAISRYTTMHIDICSIAEDKSAALILLPFHETLEEKGKDDSEDTNKSCANPIRNMNQQVLTHAQCTVGLLVDKGLGKLFYGHIINLLVFYIGGGDDREALSYAWRMASQPGVHLTVVRLIPRAVGENPYSHLDDILDDQEQGILSLIEEEERQKELDEEFLGDFKWRTATNEAVALSEVVVWGAEETLALIRNVMEGDSYQLCIVGRGNRRISPLESGLAELMEFGELGFMGDAIATSSFSKGTSVLVIQHYYTSSSQDK
ncbi:hypothetical protein SAY87_026299 [Trapa incisa]|uniref:Cation/H+ exchanger domain-containing protein n=1 Tax=Trapa incisa TaxID=236973 RepID=A0AAN7JK31_9MYRT|nr:hypothetical protein SAY87_026299 [Trapa incisa]